MDGGIHSLGRLAGLHRVGRITMSNPNEIGARLSRVESSIRDQRENLRERIRETSRAVTVRILKEFSAELKSQLAAGATLTPELIDAAIEELDSY